MTESNKEMKPIWYFVGLMLIVIGGIIFVAGIYYLYAPMPRTPELAKLNASIWWGGFMVIIGVIFLVFSKKFAIKAE